MISGGFIGRDFTINGGGDGETIDGFSGIGIVTGGGGDGGGTILTIRFRRSSVVILRTLILISRAKK
jgi:hypothetical protein